METIHGQVVFFVGKDERQIRDQHLLAALGDLALGFQGQVFFHTVAFFFHRYPGNITVFDELERFRVDDRSFADEQNKTVGIEDILCIHTTRTHLVDTCPTRFHISFSFHRRKGFTRKTPHSYIDPFSLSFPRTFLESPY